MVDFVDDVLQPAGEGFIETFVSRYLQMSEVFMRTTAEDPVQVWARRQFSQFVASNLRLAGRPFRWLPKGNARWQTGNTLWDCDLIEAFAWETGDSPRVLAYNLFVPLIKTEEESQDDDQTGEPRKGGKNVDICLLHSTPEQYRSKSRRPKIVRDAETYIALGELKGGIDPAGADEHWKTANAHLGRIRRSFDALQSLPQLFFIGNAIEASMAGEIWNQLESGGLANAANLTDDRQTVSLVSWLCRL